MIDFRGVKLDQRSVDMIVWAEKRAGFKFRIVKGSYLPADPLSSRTHCGGGAADFSVRLMTSLRREKMLKALKDAGFAAWYRTKADGFDPHVHAVAIGCVDLDPEAKRQVKDYDAKKNGLKGHDADLTYRPDPAVKWSVQAGKPVPRKVA